MLDEPRSLPPRLDPFTLIQDGDPDEVYRKLRGAGRLLRGGPGLWVVPRYREVAELLRSSNVSSFQFQGLSNDLSKERPDGVLGAGAAASFLKQIVVASSGPEHARVRKALGRVVNQTASRRLRSHVAKLVAELVDGCAARAEFDAVTELAYPLPMRVLGDLLGIPLSDMDVVGKKVLALSNVFAPVVQAASLAEADQAVRFLREVMAKLIAERAGTAGEDVISLMAAAQNSGVLTPEECVDNTIFLIFAGLETSMNLIAAGCAALGKFSDQMARLREDLTLATSAVEEILRFDAPTQITARIVREPITVDGRSIRPGRVLLLLLGSANHDHEQFAAPHELDVGRTPNPHVSFGAGAHYCLGAGLARLEGELLFAELARRFQGFEQARPPERKPHATPRVYEAVHIAVKSRSH